MKYLPWQIEYNADERVGEDGPMSVVQTCSQMEEATKRNTLEVLVIGKLAEQIKVVFGKTQKEPSNAEKNQAFILKQLDFYTIDFRAESCYVPIILSRKSSQSLS